MRIAQAPAKTPAWPTPARLRCVECMKSKHAKATSQKQTRWAVSSILHTFSHHWPHASDLPFAEVGSPVVGIRAASHHLGNADAKDVDDDEEGCHVSQDGPTKVSNNLMILHHTHAIIQVLLVCELSAQNMAGAGRYSASPECYAACMYRKTLPHMHAYLHPFRGVRVSTNRSTAPASW